ncbi:FASCICLIN-like arabinogalactan protein 15 precursor [Actinidia rufa]|uniref:FASCICLIN-like arabinogalactan protein 15 n=1 Tax=Actinidia rufa TaxID=165716 RepID=A0A7J0GEM9_9ERIC|nr:FASCICLIN-like arabinogalactan protein 15 precursor [Actinidia rufa]
MGSQIYGLSYILLFAVLLLPSSAALPPHHRPSLLAQTNSNSVQINSNSVLVALLDSHYTELAELVEKALLLQPLEATVNRHNITIFAPHNDAFERALDPDRLGSKTLSNDHVNLLGFATVIRPNDVVRPDGVIHGIERLLIPRSVQEDFNRRRSLRSIAAVLPEGAPEVDPRTHRLKAPAPAVPAGAPPVLPIFDAMAPGPSLAPAPAPGPGGPHGHFDGEAQVKDFIQTLLHYGGYNELADILVNLTSLATEMGRLVSEGYVITVLAPNDEAMAKLTTDRLSEAGAAEQIVYYHLIPEYQTEESMYNAVRRFGKVRYDTLRLPHKVLAGGGRRIGQVRGRGRVGVFVRPRYIHGREDLGARDRWGSVSGGGGEGGAGG